MNRPRLIRWLRIPSLNTRWVFGHNQGLDNTNGSWHGALDEIQFYSRVLTVSEIQLLVFEPHPQGDYNHNGTVDAADYVLWRHQLGQIVSPCSGPDANCNGFVEVGEYQTWKINYGQSAGTGSAALAVNVPEPSSLRVVVLSMIAAMGSQRRKRSRYPATRTEINSGLAVCSSIFAIAQDFRTAAGTG